MSDVPEAQRSKHEESDRSSILIAQEEFRPASNWGTWLAVCVFLTAAAARIGVVWEDPDRLNEDIDGYLALSDSLYQRGEYAFSEGEPTAFRPPLYPILISHLRLEGRALLNIALSLLTVAIVLGTVPAVRTRWPDLTNFAIDATRQRLSGLSAASSRERRMMWSTAVFCLFSPLAIYYVGYSMTETLCGFLLAVALVEATQLSRPNPRAILFIGASAAERRRTTTAVLLGVALGLACLTRPTCYAVAALWFVWLAWSGRTNRFLEAEAVRSIDPTNESGLVPNSNSLWRSSLRLPAIACAVLLLVVSPWVVRNVIVMGRPIATTTHGGYTILLGNNDGFYDDVVRQAPGTLWTDGQQKWAERLSAEMDGAGIDGELARDRWQRDLAISTISERPIDFLRASVLRVQRFFAVRPQAGQASPVIGAGVATFYTLAWIFAVVGLAVAWKERLVAFVPAALLPLAFVLVHLLYWSNARMRLPVEPAIFLFSGLGVDAIYRSVLDRERAPMPEQNAASVA